MSHPPDDVFLLARRRLRTRAATRLLIGGVLLAGVVAGVAFPVIAGVGAWRLLLLPLAGGAFLFAQGLLWRRAAPDAAIRLSDDAVFFPPGVATLSAQRVPFDDIELILAQVGGGRARVVVGTRSRVHVVNALDIGGALTLEKFHATLQARIARRPGGVERLTRIAHGLALTRKLFDRRARVTEIILGLLVAAYIAEIATGTVGLFDLLSDDITGFARLGAIVPALVEAGQWHRIITGTVLHGGLVHIYLNGMAILAVGGLLERLIGGHRLVIIYVVSAIAGSLASIHVSGGMLSLGASGALFGLVGALAAMQWRHGHRLPPGIAQSRRWWIVILGLNAALPLALPMIDFWAHLGGFVGGAIAGLAVLYSPAAVRPDQPPPFAVAALAMALAGVSMAALAVGVDHARGDTAATIARGLDRYLEGGGADPDQQNFLAWIIAEDPEASDAALQIALTAVERALVADPDDPARLDTRATLVYRLGRAADAVPDAVRALEAVPDAFFATQALRFLRASKPPPITDVRLVRDGDDLRVEADAATAAIRVLAAVRVDETDAGLAAVVARADAPETRFELARIGPPLPAGATLVPLWVDRTVAAEAATGWRHWPLDPRAEALPRR
ncbi:MAG: rhomboid family intramembrane serine protease [Myxococcales bacterium]|nr:rhomboid family intramembrane serine protease [Myxococcales bacterium]